ncbi:MAG: hypothetical protein ACPLYF_04610, partial [Fervidobacterium sp.]
SALGVGVEACPQPQEEKKVEVNYGTWGSYGQFHLSIAVLKDGSIIDPRQVRVPWRGEAVEREIQLATGEKVVIEVINNSSRKNAHYTVRIPSSVVLAVLTTGASSSGRSGWAIKQGGGKIRAIVSEERIENSEYIYVYEKTTVVYQENDITAEIEKQRTLKERIPKGAEIKIKQSGNKTILMGNTFKHKELIKQAKFRWNPIEKYWYSDAEDALENITLLLSENNISYEVIQ